MAEFQLDPKKTALVLIDLQNAVVGMNPAPHTAVQVVENSKKLASVFRGQGAPVVYVRVDLNDFMNHPVDQPHNRRQATARRSIGDRSFRWITARRHPRHQAPLGRLRRNRSRAAAQIPRHRHGRPHRHLHQRRRRVHRASGYRPGLCLCARRETHQPPSAPNTIASPLNISSRVSLAFAPPRRS